MNELIEKTEKLKESIDKADVVKEYKKSKEKIERNKDLISKIKQYKESDNQKIKEEILNNQEYRDYKKRETDINILILEINHELKKISNKGKCIK